MLIWQTDGQRLALFDLRLNSKIDWSRACYLKIIFQPCLFSIWSSQTLALTVTENVWWMESHECCDIHLQTFPVQIEDIFSQWEACITSYYPIRSLFITVTIIPHIWGHLGRGNCCTLGTLGGVNVCYCWLLPPTAQNSGVMGPTHYDE